MIGLSVIINVIVDSLDRLVSMMNEMWFGRSETSRKALRLTQPPVQWVPGLGPTPAAALSGIVGSNPSGSMDVCLL